MLVFAFGWSARAAERSVGAYCADANGAWEERCIFNVFVAIGLPIEAKWAVLSFIESQITKATEDSNTSYLFAHFVNDGVMGIVNYIPDSRILATRVDKNAYPNVSVSNRFRCGTLGDMDRRRDVFCTFFVVWPVVRVSVNVGIAGAVKHHIESPPATVNHGIYSYASSSVFIWNLNEHRSSDTTDDLRGKRVNPGPLILFQRILGFDKAQIDKKDAEKTSNSRTERYPVKPFGYPDLPFPEAPLGGAVLIVGGLWASGRGLNCGPFWLLMGGWFVSVSGGVLLLIWGLPYLAALVPL
jgi:hypothetical protein